MRCRLSVTAAPQLVRHSHRRAPLDLVGLTLLMKVTNGSSEVAIGLIDGPVDTTHPDLAAQAVASIGPSHVDSCRHVSSAACAHGSYVAGILIARRGSEAPAICPDCTLLVRPIFLEPMTNLDDLRADPGELALALADCADAGVRVVNVSAALAQPSMKDDRALTDALDHAARRGVIVVVAAGNQGTLGSTAITHSHSNVGRSIGRSGLGAPGVGISSLGAGRTPLTCSGTSAAAPFVTGAVALLCSEFPDASGHDIKSGLLAMRAEQRTTVVPPLMDAWGSYQFLQETRPGRRSR
jgi:subtilisin family serine protease